MASIIKVTTTINAPVEIVWDKLMDPENLKHWVTGFQSVEHLTGNIGEAGSTSKLRFMERGKEVEILETVLSCKPCQQYTSSMEHSSFTAESDFRLVSFGHRTDLVQTVNFRPKSFLMKLLLPIVKGAMKKRNLNELSRLKDFIETKQSK
jgi:ligand-binding SRPBCC domain-containing protein